MTPLELVMFLIVVILLVYQLAFARARARSKEFIKEQCRHGGGFCTDGERYLNCDVDDPTEKVLCWQEGVFEDDPLQDNSVPKVDIGGP